MESHERNRIMEKGDLILIGQKGEKQALHVVRRKKAAATS
jgi:hypothetical protein